MSEAAGTESLLQAYNVQYDPVLLAKQRIAFALLFRKYLAQGNLLNSRTFGLLDAAPDESVPEYSLIRDCLAKAWGDMEYAVKWNAYKS
ncbi:hypothetical protein [Paenibacillus borealis]|uniref:Uncharacterized protein n=1 Tax=Paenibacillus borealis TaxID=160799 RepID=A0A089MN62_PAEBO|nr:hypothetical protein [Paenibacillus borealis]AIQ57934.1 hypothetical protein PBOR_14120 [Paenibacillus borealis]